MNQNNQQVGFQTPQPQQAPVATQFSNEGQMTYPAQHPGQYPGQPGQPAQVAQPAQHNTVPMAQNTPLNAEGIQKVEVLLDKESIKILQEAHGQFGEAIVNLGIKMFAETDVYKTYMLREEFKKLITTGDISETGDSQSLSAMSLTPNIGTEQPTNTTKQTASTSNGGNFAAW